MLIEFRVENYRSLRDEQVLTMEAGRVGDDNDIRVRKVEGHSEPLLPVAALYGANASGKTNVLTALSFMRLAVADSHRSWGPTDGIPRDPFAWGPKRSEPSTFEVGILINGVRYEYGFSASDDAFVEEWLYAWPNGKKQIWFVREDGVFKFGDHLKSSLNSIIEQTTRPNSLFLSAAVQNKHIQLEPIYWWFNQIRPINLFRYPVGRYEVGPEYLLASLLEDTGTSSLFDDDPPSEVLLDRFRSMLKSADIGILDLRIQKSENQGDPRRMRRPRFHLKHESPVEDAWLPLEDESRGTQTLFRMALPILQLLHEGGTLVVDELEASLHPSLAQKIIGLFNDPANNPNNAQLVFTTHDTNLIGNTLAAPVLRRDQIWFTEKTHEGATVLYPLTDFRPRKQENLERGYLQGRYGAIPFLGNFAVKGE